MDASTDEIELIERAKEDKEAFGQLYERYYERIYNYVYYRTGNVADAEDLTARVFVRAMQHIPKFEYKGVPFSAWLYRIAHNLVANWHRDRSRRKLITIDDVVQWYTDSEDPEFMTELLEDRERLLMHIHRLPEDRRELLILKYVDRLSNAEIGEVMGRSEGAIKSLYHRTLLALRKEMKEELPSSLRSRLFRFRRLRRE